MRTPQIGEALLGERQDFTEAIQSLARLEGKILGARHFELPHDLFLPGNVVLCLRNVPPFHFHGTFVTVNHRAASDTPPR